ncbi:MAG TPA: hypothetical protein VH374_15605 [Polyangia bacterium]|nr:hypothetical protein [Polyangia bacterium]
MTGALEDLKTGVAPQTCDILVDTPDRAWVRVRDLVVGLVRTWPDDADQEMRAAYDALDGTATLRDDELWNVVLVVALHGDPSTAIGHVDRINRDLSRSRKIALVQGEAFPPFFAPVTGDLSGDPAGEKRTDPLRGALDRIASGPLRDSLEVLLRIKRPAAEVDALIAALSGAVLP